MGRRVGTDEASTLVRAGHVLLDVRTVEEFATGHPAGAFNVPLVSAGGATNEAFVRAVERRFPKSQGIVVSCATGVRSLRAQAVLEAAGFVDVVDLRPGWSGTKDAFGRKVETGWRDAGLPAATDAEPGHAWADLEPT